DLVLELLDVEPASGDYDWEKQNFGIAAAKYSREAARGIEEARKKRFSNFTREQAESILMFLSESKGWKDFQNMSEVQSSAETYWTKRAQSKRGKQKGQS